MLLLQVWVTNDNKYKIHFSLSPSLVPKFSLSWSLCLIKKRLINASKPDTNVDFVKVNKSGLFAAARTVCPRKYSSFFRRDSSAEVYGLSLIAFAGEDKFSMKRIKEL